MTNFYCGRWYNRISLKKTGGESLFQTVYADVLFVIDFTMDFLAIFLTSQFLKRKISVKRIILSATIGAFYSVITVVLKLSSIILTLLIAAFICLTAFGRCSVKVFLHILTVYISINFLFGGGMTALFSFFNSKVGEKLVMIYGDIGRVANKLPLNVFLIGATVISVFVFTFGRIFSRKGVIRTVKAEIEISGKHESFILTEDSGNMLTEGISGEPVVFLSAVSLSRLLGKETVSALTELNTDILSGEKLKMRLTVYKTVSGKEMCMCIRPERIILDGKSVRAWIACASGGTFGEYDGIAPSSLLVS